MATTLRNSGEELGLAWLVAWVCSAQATRISCLLLSLGPGISSPRKNHIGGHEGWNGSLQRKGSCILKKGKVCRAEIPRTSAADGKEGCWFWGRSPAQSAPPLTLSEPSQTAATSRGTRQPAQLTAAVAYSVCNLGLLLPGWKHVGLIAHLASPLPSWWFCAQSVHSVAYVFL